MCFKCIYFFCWNNVDLKYTSSVIQQVEVYILKYTWSILEVYLKYDSNILEVCFKYTLEVYFQYIWSTLKVCFTLVRDDLLFATDKNGIQSSYPDDWAHHPGTFSKQHFVDMTHSNASCTHCYLGHRQLYWLTLCMYTPSQSHQPAILHSVECYIHKQNEFVMIQEGHTILVLECKTWKIRFLCWDICLWMHCTVLIVCTEPIAFVWAHFNRYSHSPSFQASVDGIHHFHRNFGVDREFLVEVFYLFLGRFCQNSSNL